MRRSTNGIGTILRIRRDGNGSGGCSMMMMMMMMVTVILVRSATAAIVIIVIIGWLFVVCCHVVVGAVDAGGVGVVHSVLIGGCTHSLIGSEHVVILAVHG